MPQLSSSMSDFSLQQVTLVMGRVFLLQEPYWNCRENGSTE